VSDVTEHEHEPIRGLPGFLPAGEELLWQGAPSWKALARRAFHTRKLAAYFGVLLLWRGISAWSANQSVQEAVVAVLWLLPLAIAAVGIMGLLAWLVSRTTVYSITSQRVVLRIGVVLSITFNIPYRVIESAGLRVYADGTGDIPLTMIGADRIAYLNLWPHARPWRIARPEPMLRAIPDAARIGEILSAALAAAVGGAARPVRNANPGTMAPAVKSRRPESLVSATR
jgi:hypothetical protein